MKFVLILVIALSAASAVPHPRVVQQEWNSFKSKHLKVYNSADEEAKRLAIFHQNLIKIEEHNKLYEQGLSTFKMGVTSFADMTSEEFMAYVNKSGIQNRPPVRGEKVVLPSVNAPKSVDWRTKNILTPVKDQGKCLSAYSFAATGALEALYALATGKVISLSEQQLIDCSTEYGNTGCDGGLPDLALIYVMENYISYEDSYPYEGKEGKCRQGKASPVRISNVDAGPLDHETIRSTIAKGPIPSSVHATSKWQLYHSGILVDTSCDPQEVNHGILLVGYDADSEYYIIKNSWGSRWGEDGYIRFSYKNNCGIENYALRPVI